MHPIAKNYQSYQSGIETKNALNVPSVLGTINRTKVELKRIKQIRLLVMNYYQSYQSGIETTNHKGYDVI